MKLLNGLGLGLVGAGLLVVGMGLGLYTGISSDTKPKDTVKTTTVVDTQASTVGILPVKEKTIPLAKLNIKSEQIVLLNSEVFDGSITLVIDQLEKIKETNKEAYIVIDSPGGSVVSGARLIAYMEASDMKINTICAVLCASMGAQIHQAGKVRYVHDKSILMFHPAFGGAQGTIEQMLNQLNMFKKYIDRFDAKTAKRAGMPLDKFQQMFVTDLWIEGSDALSSNLADKMTFLTYKDEQGKGVFNLEKELKVRGIESPFKGTLRTKVQEKLGLLYEAY